MFWRKKKPKCEAHEFEVVTRGSEHITDAGSLGIDIEYFERTTAKCVVCGFTRTLNVKRRGFVLDGELIAVHRDPLGIYAGLLSEVDR